MDKNMRILNFIGIATKAGTVISGSELCMRMLRRGKIKLLIIAGDAHFNTRNKFERACRVHEVKNIIIGDRYELGRFTGKGVRTVVGIMDDSFGNRIYELATGVD